LDRRAGLKRIGNIGDEKMKFEDIVQMIEKTSRGKFSSQEVLD
jgi:hypothetical protein